MGNSCCNNGSSIARKEGGRISMSPSVVPKLTDSVKFGCGPSEKRYYRCNSTPALIMKKDEGKKKKEGGCANHVFENTAWSHPRKSLCVQKDWVSPHMHMFAFSEKTRRKWGRLWPHQSVQPMRLNRLILIMAVLCGIGHKKYILFVEKK